VNIDYGTIEDQRDFISVTLAEQWHIKRLPLTKLDNPVCGSGLESKVDFGTRIWFQYKGTDYDRYFDVINLKNYNLILGPHSCISIKY